MTVMTVNYGVTVLPLRTTVPKSSRCRKTTCLMPGEHSASVQVELDIPQIHSVQLILSVGLCVWHKGSKGQGLVVAGFVVRVLPEQGCVGGFDQRYRVRQEGIVVALY
jgi:hypothetical protein